MPPPIIYSSLRDKNVLITGGASGIGAEMVACFADQGSRVAFIDVDTKAGKQLVSDLGSKEVFFFECDLTKVEILRGTLARIQQRFGGGLDVLINNAARDDRHDYRNLEPEHWDHGMAINLRHHFFAIQAVAPGMAARGGGSIVNLGSTAWMLGVVDLVGYNTAKAAIVGLTRAMARELGEQKIRVNSILPGAILTDRQKRLWLTPELNQAFLDRQALKFRLEPSDVAQVALFLASDAARGCTGQGFIVDAGLTLG
jgi:NAD(P)-dependent dehydrogenase (short-subunit alcohol dehydrogenase family)